MSCGSERASPRDATARPAGAEVTRAAAPVPPAGRSCGTPGGWLRGRARSPSHGGEAAGAAGSPAGRGGLWAAQPVPGAEVSGASAASTASGAAGLAPTGRAAGVRGGSATNVVYFLNLILFF